MAEHFFFIKVEENTIRVPFIRGETILSALQRSDFPIHAPCGGNGKCGKCLVHLWFGDTLTTVQACSSPASEGITVILPSRSSKLTWEDATLTRELSTSALGTSLGVAIDLGTTSIAASLFDLSSGQKLAGKGEWNRQQSWGADVITRISYTIDHLEGLSVLSGCVRSQLRDMIADLCSSCGRHPSEVTSAFLAGNTTMQHIFASLSPADIARAPFKPMSFFTGGGSYSLDEIPVTLSPCVSGYVGGDITSGILALQLDEKEALSLLIDVGTNGEMVLGGKQGFITCAVACGPAFEGAGISCGMTAEEGAINRVFLTDEGLGYEVIGEGKAKGICGSGLLDLVACLLELGYISPDGQLLLEEDETAFYLTDSVFLTPQDIRQLQLAKAAVAAGIRILLSSTGLSESQIDALYLAGGFGTRLNPASAAAIGMLPPELAGRVKPAGNASLSGAEEALLSPGAYARLLKIRGMCSYIELSGSESFNTCFLEELAFPEAVE